MIPFVLVILLGLFDRMRGAGWFPYSHAAGLAGMGVVTAQLLGVHGWTSFYVVSAVALGAAPGWGNPLGAAFDGRKMGTNYEWWQVGPLRKCTLLALIFRGFMWGALLAPVSWWAMFAFAIPFFVTPYIVRHNWAWMEVSRGTFIGLLLLVAR